ncbi:MAG: N-formylglutamate amidohydrolase [Anaerolineaceae bacterium]|nr:N-formylglutamate amidohydrolase [Anaerolineaceae bacterium]
MKRLPILISIPHGGTSIPEELARKVRLKESDILADIDIYTPDLFDIGKQVQFILKTDIARTFIDLNRSPVDLPNSNPDGVVKTTTCLGVPIYNADFEINRNLVSSLLDRYYHSYHGRIRKALQTPGLKLALDCHSMLPYGPKIGPDCGQSRPLICLGNNFNKSSSKGDIKRLAACLRHSFRIPINEVTYNTPFSGGYITRRYGNRPIPWIQIELNRQFYLDELDIEHGKFVADSARLLELNGKFAEAVSEFINSKALH